MTKRFCDACGDELGLSGGARLVGTAILTNIGKAEIEVNVVKLRPPSDGELLESPMRAHIRAGSPDLCRSCILEAVDTLKIGRK